MDDALLADARACFRAGVHGVRPATLFAHLDLGALLPRPLADFAQIRVVGTGKAAMAMAGAWEAQLPQIPFTGEVVVPHGYPETFPPGPPRPQQIRFRTASHPVPDAAGVAAAEAALAAAEACGDETLLLVLISGGGSSLWLAPAAGLSLAELQATFGLLLRSGADIHALNTVRKHLSRIGGGQLAAAAFPATTLALVISDVVGDDLSVIASGPTVGDPTTFADAVQVLRDFSLWEAVPRSVRQHLAGGAAGATPDTPTPGAPHLQRAHTHLLGSNRDAREAAAAEAARRGYRVFHHETPVTGEARDAATHLAATIRASHEDGPACHVWGGETTVTVTGNGRGGRNQELALAMALALQDCARPCLFLSGGTDGRDGPTDAAGAWVTPATVRRATQQNLDATAYLARNDSHAFFSHIDQLLQTGPTHTNVMDLQLALLR